MLENILHFVACTLCLVVGTIILLTEGVTILGLLYYQFVYLMLILKAVSK